LLKRRTGGISSRVSLLHYILVDRKPVPTDLMTWAKWFEDHSNRIVAQEMHGNVQVSTVFLGFDHGLSRTGSPLLFETMIFGGPEDGWQDRYFTWEEAEAGHQEACKLAFGTKTIP